MRLVVVRLLVDVFTIVVWVDIGLLADLLEIVVWVDMGLVVALGV